MKKKIKDGSLYFRQKDIARPLGAGLTMIGIVWFWLGMSMASYYIPGVITPLGLILFFVGGARYISEGDMAAQLEHAMLDYDKSVTDLANYDRYVLRQPAPVETAAYSFGEGTAYYKKGKNGTPVSDIYVGTHFFFTRDALLAVGRRVTIAALNTETGEGIRPFSETLPFAAIRAATIEEHETTVSLTSSKKPMTVKWYELVITAAEEGAEELLRLPVRNDMDIIGLCDDINRRAL